jgi:hypothetical protein
MNIGDNGTLTFWDYATGTPFQNMDDIPQPGSLEAEAGVFCSTFDQTGTRLITGGADKTIKVCQLFFSLPRSVYLILTSADICRTIAIACIQCGCCTIVVLPVLVIRYLLLSLPYFICILESQRETRGPSEPSGTRSGLIYI